MEQTYLRILQRLGMCLRAWATVQCRRRFRRFTALKNRLNPFIKQLHISVLPSEYMDDSVLKAIAKWPNVPDVFNWLGLDRRGNWLLKNDRIRNPVINEFIGRNYLADEHGCWFFQNGPQRVYVALEYTPYVVHISGQGSGATLVTHTGDSLTHVTGAWIDEDGNVLVDWPSGVGVICDRDLAEVVSWFTDSTARPFDDAALESLMGSTPADNELNVWLHYRSDNVIVERIRSTELSQRFGFVPVPEPAPGQPEC
jgi:hypothetical protein